MCLCVVCLCVCCCLLGDGRDMHCKAQQRQASTESHIFERPRTARAHQNRGTPQVCLNLYIYYYAQTGCVLCVRPHALCGACLLSKEVLASAFKGPSRLCLSSLPLGAHTHTDLLPALAKIQGPCFFCCALFLTHPPHGQISLCHDHRKLTLPDL